MKAPTGTEEVDEAEITEALEILQGNKEFVFGMAELGQHSPLESLGLEERLTNPNTAPAILQSEFGLNINNPLLTFEAEGTEGGSGEGKIIITKFQSNEADLFIFKLDYADGDTRWMLGPEGLPETDFL